AIVNVSSTVVKDIERLAAKVEALRFDGVALLPPIYYSVSNREQLVDYIKSIVQPLQTPFLYYHIPSMSGELKCKLLTYSFKLVKTLHLLCLEVELDSFVELALETIP